MQSSGSIIFTARVVVVLAVLLPPLWLRLLITRREQDAFAHVQRCARLVVRALGCHIDLRSTERVPDGETVMFVSNHVSIADAAVLIAVLPYDLRFVANHIFARYPLLGPAIRGASANIVDRGSWRSRADSGRAMVEALERGQSLLVFPEGTTSAAGGMLPFRSGAFRAAARTGRRVVPIALRGTRAMMPAGRRLLANAPIVVEVLEPIAPDGAARESVARLRDASAAAIKAWLAEADR